MNTLQNILLANLEFGAHTDCYFRHDGNVLLTDVAFLAPGSRMSLDTYYNAFSTQLWKDRCGLNNVMFSARGEGKCYMRLMLTNEQGANYELASNYCTLTERDTLVFDYDLANLSYNGLLYVEIIALESAVIFKGGRWSTKEAIKRDVNLGIVVTHFNRKNYVLPAIARVKKAILDNPEYCGHIQFSIVDNSQNITSEEAQGVNVIPNENLGGSGGFMRGLLHYKDEGKATHVLFMDDDASCEMESIIRAYHILQFVTDDELCIAGSLFDEDVPNRFIEKGANFDGVCRANCAGLHMCWREDLLRAEFSTVKVSYAAWWFFVFPIQAVKHYSFPFFVRGDDVLFSLLNEMKIIAPLGIACYGENFGIKDSVSTLYLSSRISVISLTMNTSMKDIVKGYLHHIIKATLLYRYESAEAVRMALYDVFSGSKFWKENYDMQAVFKRLKNITHQEVMKPVDISQLNLVPHPGLMLDESKLKRLIRWASFNGLFLPKKRGVVVQNNGLAGGLRQIARYEGVFYYNPKTKMGCALRPSRFKTLKYLWLAFWDTVFIVRNLSKMRKEYQTHINELTSEEFWRKALHINTPQDGQK